MEEFVERVRAGSDILSVASAYVSLKRKGRRYWGCCPFHQEKTASFSVTPDNGFFYCFGCHAGGDVFKFLMMAENVSFMEAVRLQAEKLNISLPKKEKSEKEQARDRHFAELRRVQEMARDFFHSCLTKTPYGTAAMSYLSGRGISAATVEEFHIGFAPEAFEKLYMAFRKRGISDELLTECGLVVARESGGFYDRFRGRVMIPIADEFGHIAGFGGRVLGDGLPKYLNSPETALFNKRRLLFGLDRSKQAIRQAGCAIIVEGYMDAISLYAAGIKNVVASLGTAFTIEQCRKILRYAPKIYFCYDSDEAGQQATIRALSVVRETGAIVNVLTVPEGKDPDEFVRKHGAEAFQRLVDNALPLVEYQIKYVLKHNNYSTLEGKTAALMGLLPVLSNVANMVELNEHIAYLTRTLGIDEGILRSELNRYSGRAVREEPVSRPLRQAVRQVDNAVCRAGRIVLRQVWQDGDKGQLLSELAAYLPFDSFPYPLQGRIFSYFEECLLSGRPLAEAMSGTMGDEATGELSRALAEPEGDEESGKAYADALKVLRKAYLGRQYEERRQRADALEREGNPSALQELAECQRIKKEMDELRIG